MRFHSARLLPVVLLAALIGFHHNTAHSKTTPIEQIAISENAARAATGIEALREMGPESLHRLFALRVQLERQLAQLRALPATEPSALKAATTRLTRLDNVIDQVGGAKYCTASRLYWFTDLEKAQMESRKTGKPILSLRMMGKLTDEYSCANSRFFRTTLYANAEISRLLRENYVLHWQSVRPVPRVTIDFGDGRKLERTLTGNSAHYVLARDGRPLDVLPGLYGPTAFTAWLHRARQLADSYERAAAAERPRLLVDFHRKRGETIAAAWSADLAAVAPAAAAERADEVQPPVAAKDAVPPQAAAAAQLAVSKAVVEIPILDKIELNPKPNVIVLKTDQLLEATSGEVWNKIAALHSKDARLDEASIELMRRQNPTAAAAALLAVSKSRVEDPLVRLVQQFERSIALDTVRNEYLLHRRIHEWFAGGEPTADFDALNNRIYAELFLTPNSDPWLGLVSPNTYTALPNDGVTRAN